MTNPSNDAYALGDHEAELQRLVLQGEVWAAFTESLLRRAGVGPGMRVLDLGSGAGDVALMAAKLVGEGGSVLGPRMVYGLPVFGIYQDPWAVRLHPDYVGIG